MTVLITAAEVVAAATIGGFSNDDLETAVSISFAEDGNHQVDRINHNSDGSVDRGLWQINSVHTQFDANQLLTDAAYNAKAAVAVSNGGNNWSPWVTYPIASSAQIPAAKRAIAQYDSVIGDVNQKVGTTNPLSGQNNPLNPSSWTWADGLLKLLSYLTSGAFWQRIGIFVAGAVLLLFAVVVIFRRQAEDVGKAAVI